MVTLVAEIAQGYEGHRRQAELLAIAGVKAGADVLKFQLVLADELATSDYQYYDLFKQLEMPIEAWESVAKISHDAGRKLYFDIFGSQSFDTAMRVGADGFKLSTTEFYNEDLTRKVLATKKDTLISIGGIPITEVEDLIKRNHLTPKDNVCFMYGFQSEPTPLESNNLLRLNSLQKRFEGFRFGFMDHSLGGDSEDSFILPLRHASAATSFLIASPKLNH